MKICAGRLSDKQAHTSTMAVETSDLYGFAENFKNLSCPPAEWHLYGVASNFYEKLQKVPSFLKGMIYTWLQNGIFIHRTAVFC